MKRDYRNSYGGNHLHYYSISQKETDLKIGSDKILKTQAMALVEKYRKQIEEYIESVPSFLLSLNPIEGSSEIGIIKEMCEESRKVNVGPFAGVAGAINKYVGYDLLKHCNELIIENGGDLFIKCNNITKVGLYAGNSPFTGKISILVNSEKYPVGISTSSGTVGHSLSFGKADAAMVISYNIVFSDVLATAVGNMVKNENDIESALDYAMKFRETIGALIVVGDRIGFKGDIVTAKTNFAFS